MDPNILLSRLRKLAEDLAERSAGVDADTWELADGFQSLDEWLTRGGFKPQDWA